MKKEYLFVGKNWGYEKIIDNNEKYCGKILFIAKNKKMSLHYHQLKSESFFILNGKVILYYYENVLEVEEYMRQFGNRQLYSKLNKIILEKGDVFYIPAGMVHQLISDNVDSEVIEFSTTHRDEDSYRIIKGD